MVHLLAIIQFHSYTSPSNSIRLYRETKSYHRHVFVLAHCKPGGIVRWTMDDDMFVNSFHSILHFIVPWNWNKYSEVILTVVFAVNNCCHLNLTTGHQCGPDSAKLWKVQNQAYRYYLVVSNKHSLAATTGEICWMPATPTGHNYVLVTYYK